MKIALYLAGMALCLALAMPAFGEPVELTDNLGRTVTIDQPCHKIVFLVENALNTYYSVGDPQSVLAVGNNIFKSELKMPFFEAVDPDFGQKGKIGFESGLVNLEALAAEDPDLVVLWATSPEAENLKAINDTLGIPVYAVFVTSIDDMYKQVEDMGIISGRVERASDVEAIMKGYMEEVTSVTDGIPDEERPKVYWMWTDVLGTTGRNSGFNDIIYQAGGINVMNYWDNDASYEEHPPVPLETLISLNPDVIYMWYNENLDPEDVINGTDFAGWKDINAVKAGRVYEIENPFLFDAFSPRMPMALMHLAKNIQPELFADLSIDDKLDGFFVEMYSVHYPEYEHT
ncbi:MAG: ABC transporter substrate-binding protein [Methanotrichaceae archaeon]|nr:ABC transporter substrate-binding protein [Methanotrichaceae archaeon]